MTNPLQLSVLALAGRALHDRHVRARRRRPAPWVLDANNWQEGKDLLPEPVVKRLKDGRVLVQGRPGRSGEVQATNYAKKFWDATEANEGKYDLEPKRAA